MQCNPSFYAGYPGSYQPCNTPFQPQWRSPYPDVIGEGEVASVALPDGSLQLYFLPTTKWPPSFSHNLNIPIYHPSCNSNLGVWIVRSVSNPVPGPIYSQPNQLPCGFPTFPRTCFPCNSNIALPLLDHQLKFHNDGWTSTTDIHYFFPRIRPCAVVPNPSAGVQVTFAPCADTQTNTEDSPCICDDSSQENKKKNKVQCECYKYVDSSDSYMSVEDTRSRRSKRNKRKTSKGRKKSKERKKSKSKKSKEQKKCTDKKEKRNHPVKCECEPSTSKDTSSQSTSRLSILSIDSPKKKLKKDDMCVCSSTQGSTSNMSTDDCGSKTRKKSQSNHVCECYSNSAVTSQSCSSIDQKAGSKGSNKSKSKSFSKPDKKSKTSEQTCGCHSTEKMEQGSGVKSTRDFRFGSSSRVSKKDDSCECHPPIMNNKAVTTSKERGSCITQQPSHSSPSCCNQHIPCGLITRDSFKNCGAPELWYLKEDPFDTSGMPETWYKKHDAMNISGSSDCESVKLNSYQ